MRSKLDKRTIEYVGTSSLTPYARNSRTHLPEQVKQIAASIREFGFTNPVLIDDEGTIIAGHGRVLAAQHLQLAEVPCIRLGYLTETQRRAYVIADNKLALNAGWDEELLKLELEDLHLENFDLGKIGFDAKELSEAMGLDDKEIVEDEVPEPPADPITKPGDMWILGDHRLLCGDSTKETNFAAQCSTLFFDPPWDAGVKMLPRECMLAFCDGQRISDVVRDYGAPTWAFAWDCITSWYTPARPLRRMKICLWYGDINRYDQDGSHYGDAGESRTVTNSRGSYKFTPDPRGKHLSDVYTQAITALHAESEHSHSKPLDWVRMLIANCTHGDIYDPFLGSGTTLIAAEQLGRKCYGMEISPAYCDVIVKRWETFTGRKAELVNG
jgi:hypothetical protein